MSSKPGAPWPAVHLTAAQPSHLGGGGSHQTYLMGWMRRTQSAQKQKISKRPSGHRHHHHGVSHQVKPRLCGFPGAFRSTFSSALGSLRPGPLSPPMGAPRVGLAAPSTGVSPLDAQHRTRTFPLDPAGSAGPLQVPCRHFGYFHVALIVDTSV